MTRTLHTALWLSLLVVPLAAAQAEGPVGRQIGLFNPPSGTAVTWKAWHAEPGVKLEDVWTIADSTVTCKGRPLGYLRTEQDFTNFVLRLEWRWPSDKKPGSGGVLIRMTGDDKIWPKSLEAQLNAGAAGDLWGLGGYTLIGPPDRMKSLEHPQLGKLTNVAKLKDLEKLAGEWNQYEIIADGPVVTLRINGQEVNRATGCDVVPGKICLTAEGDAIEFRNVRLALIEESPKTKEPPAAVDLFNGKDFTGWTCHLREPGAKLENTWSVRDGVLRCEGRPVGYLRTEKKYTSYVLKLQWRWPEDSKPGNSGVLLRIVGEDKVWPKSVEAQLAANSAGDILTIDEFPLKGDAERTRGRRTAKMNPSNEKPQGEWNEYEMTLKGGDLTIKVNGEVQNAATEVEVVPGWIGLQSEGAPIEFRQIKLLTLE